MAKIKYKPKYRYRHVGRPTDLTEEVVKKLEEAFAIGANVKQACFYANISRETYYTWMEKNPLLSDRLEEVREKLPLHALKNIAESIQGFEVKGNISLSQWLLEKRQQGYENKIAVEHSGEVVGGSVHTEDADAIAKFHSTLKENMKKRNLKEAEEKGELIKKDENSSK